jgi:hypothetical protein
MLLSNRAMIGSNPENLYAFTNSLTTEWALRNNRSNWNKTGRLRNYHCGDANVSGLTIFASQPAGNTHPVAYVLAQKPGRVSSHKICYIELDGDALASIGSLIFTSACVVSVDGAATGTLIIGSLIDGTVALVIDASAVGIMSLGGAGEAVITVTASGAILGNVPAAGSAPIEIGAIVSAVALGWLAGAGPIEIDATLDPYAAGWLAGTTAEAGLTPTGIANAVWNAIAASLNASGSMGEKMNAAGAAGDPWLTELPGAYAAGSAGDIIGNQIPAIKTLADFLSHIEGGKWKIEGNQMIFYKSDNLTEVARFNLFNAAGVPSMTEVFERRRA